jgi:hypothetical protein
MSNTSHCPLDQPITVASLGDTPCVFNLVIYRYEQISEIVASYALDAMPENIFVPGTSAYVTLEMKGRRKSGL